MNKNVKIEQKQEHVKELEEALKRYDAFLRRLKGEE